MQELAYLAQRHSDGLLQSLVTADVLLIRLRGLVLYAAITGLRALCLLTRRSRVCTARNC